MLRRLVNPPCDTHRRPAAHGTDLLVLSFGADTFDGDPISNFKLREDDYRKIGARIAAIGLPTLVVMEGGYAIDALGRNVDAILSGFEEVHPA